MAAHEHAALLALLAIAVHGITLLGEPLAAPGRPGRGAAVRDALPPAFTGLGIIAGYGAALMGLTFYLRRRIGMKLWRRVHRFTIVAYALSVVHTLGAGSDAGSPWLRGAMLATAGPIIFLS